VEVANERLFDLAIDYDNKPDHPAPVVKLNGKVIDGTHFSLDAGQVGHLAISEKGYSAARLTITAKQQPGPLEVKLKHKGGGRKIWLPQ
jgi:hypothetical protein